MAHDLAAGELDAMISIEGIEHLENPSLFVRECARVVKPGGLVFLSTPNVDSYRSRRSVHLHGFHKYFKLLGHLGIPMLPNPLIDKHTRNRNFSSRLDELSI